MRFPLLLLVLAPSLACGQPRSPVVSNVDRAVFATETAKGHWFIDFGKAAFGNLEIRCPGNTGERVVTVHLGEALAEPHTINRSPGGTVRYQRHVLTLRPNETSRPNLTWTPPGWMKSGWLERPATMSEVMPFRYVEIEQAPEGFSADWVRRVSWSVPFEPDASEFHSSSPELNSVWHLCKYSIKATSFLGLYVDGDRERKPYEADALINQLAHYCVDQRYDTARLTHEYLLEHPTWPTEWRLQSVMMGWLDFLWSGDDSSLKTHYDTLKARAMLGRRTRDGLFRGYPSRSESPGLEDIIDWPAVERDRYDMSVPVKTVVTAWHYQALTLLEKMATHLGKPTEARQFKDLAAETYESFNRLLWDEARGCYIDGIVPDSGERSPHASAHANLFPLALGLVPAERVERVAAFLNSRGMACSVYGAQFLIEALYEAGEAQKALELMTSDATRSWRNMSEKVGSTITLEAWDPAFKPNLDWNHAWGAAPANLIPRGLMGIDPLEPGFKRFRVRPQTASLTEASIKMPTPRGPITLAIHHTAEAGWRCTIVVPEGTTAEFHLPPLQPDSLRLSPGEPRPLGIERDRRVIELGSGKHEIQCRPPRGT